MTEMVFLVIRCAAAFAGVMVGYFVTGPALRLLYRLAFRRPVPGWLLPLGRLGGGMLLGALIFFFLPLGGGPGWGWGPGWGAGPGDGTAQGTQGNGGVSGDKVKPANGGKKPKPIVREKLVIELLGGKRYPGEGRYYLLKSEPPPRTLGEVEEHVKDKADKFVVHVLITDESVAASHPAVGRLHDLLQRYGLPTVQPRAE
ncbi:MAG: hypothetical protein L0Y71_26205 [Gemmataceae bacterium]|nr:hypothetical protein [Gemmataceae bacterium]